ncbi:MAG: right-handed parallel beta-helix repeat-containing protein [Candidatus Sumerlaeota bacterium]|nr:right-handed parallel beta-helix repeat-containing protein [Candidatus Sumerlaeota bacterium]
MGNTRWTGLFLLFILTSVISQEAVGARLFVDGAVGVSGDGSSWASAKKTIGEAAALAAAGDEIWVAEGTYLEAVTFKSGVALYGGFARTESTPDDRDIAAHPTILDASTANGGAPAYHTVTMDGVHNARLDGFTITGGRASVLPGQGGGLYCRNVDGPTTVAQCRVAGNKANAFYSDPSYSFDVGEGGGIYCENASLTFEDCVIEENSSGSEGGGVFYHNSTILLTGCQVSRNSAYGWETRPPWWQGNIGYGGGMDGDGVSLTLRNCQIAGNQSGRIGGGIYCRGGSLFMEECQVGGNQAFGVTHFRDLRSDVGDGGGIWSEKAQISISRCRFQGNTTVDCGGGVCLNTDASGALANCILVGNSSIEGGAVSSFDAAALSIDNCTVVGNSAHRGGGVSVWWDSVSTSTLRNTIFVDNWGYAIYEGDSGRADAVPLRCLFFGNPDGDFFDEGSTGYTGAAEINAHVAGASGNLDGDPLFEILSQGTWTAAPVYDHWSDLTTFTDAAAAFVPGTLEYRMLRTGTPNPITLPIADNTTTTLQIPGYWSWLCAAGDPYWLLGFHLGPGSAAVDTGGPGAPPVDYDGNPRPIDIPGLGADGTGTEFDIGAYEMQGIRLVPPVADLGGGQAALAWTSDGAPPLQFLGFAWDLYARYWVPRGWNGTMWFPFPSDAASGAMDLGLSGGYHVWISSQWTEGWLPCHNPWTGIEYSGAPHTPLDVTVADQGGLRVRLAWRPEIYGTWHWQVIAWQAGQGWVATQGPDGAGLWHFLLYPSPEFLAGAAEFTMPSAGDYWLFLRGAGWLAPYPTGEWGAVFVSVAP